MVVVIILSAKLEQNILLQYNCSYFVYLENELRYLVKSGEKHFFLRKPQAHPDYHVVAASLYKGKSKKMLSEPWHHSVLTSVLSTMPCGFFISDWSPPDIHVDC